MKCELISDDNLKYRLDDINLSELTIIVTLLKDELLNKEKELKKLKDNKIRNENTEWLENRIILLKDMIKSIEEMVIKL